MRHLYIWSNVAGKTCFGITSNLDNRRRKYEGHNGFAIEFTDVFSGPANHIEDLETQIKNEFDEHLFHTGIGKYEWINETIATEQVVGWIQWEIENTYNNQITKA
jgi:hypothetical protein|tara:strand:- start:5356 stop:5670 length:315 start_codon:yes stop_codon:yes gene_type:complete